MSGLFGPMVGGFRWVACGTAGCQLEGERVEVPLYRIGWGNLLANPEVLCVMCLTVPLGVLPTVEENAKARKFLGLDEPAEESSA